MVLEWGADRMPSAQVGSVAVGMSRVVLSFAV